ncbi:glycerophosphodiester phosphodiesterase family protein [Aquimarina sp. AU474]|uniref:glycerophosphodiester phosphodiesterase n=1 Tax=Aquimarina sp. AU474 TaxID=2108529 RepID=UPI000D691A1E|nr:glycerophosphodiester phosphodiesterase family protein [Aquimarina sp. AU474]
MKIFGHRGAAGLKAENTIESISEALKFGVNGIEVDVHCCKSGELIVIHDQTLDRTTNIEGAVLDYTLVELQKFTTKEGFLIPTLDQVLKHIDAKCELNVELKGERTALATVRLLEKYIKDTNWQYQDFIISSFDHQQLYDVKKMNPKFKIGVLTEENIDVILPIAKDLDAFSVHPPISSLTKKEVDVAVKQGFKVFVWTVNDIFLIQQSKSWKVDGIITDFPNFAE